MSGKITIRCCWDIPWLFQPGIEARLLCTTVPNSAWQGHIMSLSHTLEKVLNVLQKLM